MSVVLNQKFASEFRSTTAFQKLASRCGVRQLAAAFIGLNEFVRACLRELAPAPHPSAEAKLPSDAESGAGGTAIESGSKLPHSKYAPRDRKSIKCVQELMNREMITAEGTPPRCTHDTAMRFPTIQLTCKTNGPEDFFNYYRRSYSGSRRLFLRLRLRASAALTRFFSPGFR